MKMDIEKLDMEIVIEEVQVLMVKLEIKPTLLEDIHGPRKIWGDHSN